MKNAIFDFRHRGCCYLGRYRSLTRRMAEIQTGLNDTWFAWSGPDTHEPNRNGSAYYRIQRPKLVMEFSPQGVGGDSTMHVHRMYRNPTKHYGIRFRGAQ